MANLYGVNATKWLAKPMQLAEQGHQSGNLKECYDKFTLTADLAAADVIYMGKIPQGARVIDCRVVSADLDAQSAGTISVGWAAGAKGVEALDVDGFATTLDVSTAAIAYSMFTTASTSAGFQKTFAEEVQVIVTIVGETDATSGSIHVEVLYVID